MPDWLTPSLLGLALVVLAVALSWAILRNLSQGQRFRARLAERLEQLRLQRLLRLLGLDPTRYLHEQPIVDVNRHMHTCARCPETVRCDRALEEHKPEVVASYCANFDELQAMRERRQPDA